jgi:hypothetical protein
MKRVINAAIISLLLVNAVPALAQGALNSKANTGKMGGFGHSSWRGTETPFDYNQVPTSGYNGGVSALAPQGWADYTNNQGAASPNGPLLYGTPSFAAGPFGQSGAATGAPFAGTFAAPANMALRQIGRGTLPPTRLTSFIQDSGMSEAIYGDEGTDGPPPFEGFDESHRIERGMVTSGELTTGHKSDAPSAWGYPQ